MMHHVSTWINNAPLEHIVKLESHLPNYSKPKNHLDLTIISRIVGMILAPTIKPVLIPMLPAVPVLASMSGNLSRCQLTVQSLRKGRKLTRRAR